MSLGYFHLSKSVFVTWKINFLFVWVFFQIGNFGEFVSAPHLIVVKKKKKNNVIKKTHNFDEYFCTFSSSSCQGKILARLKYFLFQNEKVDLTSSLHVCFHKFFLCIIFKIFNTYYAKFILRSSKVRPSKDRDINVILLGRIGGD